MYQNAQLNEWFVSLGIRDELSEHLIQSGQLLDIVLRKVIKNYKSDFIAPTPVNRIQNWNNLIKQLQKLKIKVPTEEKNQILQNNLRTIQKIFKQIKDQLNEQKPAEVDLNKIDAKSDPKQSKSLLELLVLVIMKNFALNMKQSVALLSNDSKYLAHVLAKGFKDQPAPVISLLKDFQQLQPQIQQFCINKENQSFYLKSIKPGLISRHRQISQLSLEILKDFALQTSNPFQTFRQHLLSTMVLQNRRHPALIDLTCNAIIKLSKYAKTLLSVLTLEMTQKEFLVFSYEILSIATQSDQVEYFYSLAKVDELFQLAIDSLKNSDSFQIALLIILKGIQTNPTIIVNEPKTLTAIVTNLEQLTINKFQSSISYINGLFTLFTYLYNEGNIIAPIIFRVCIQKFKSTTSEDQCLVFGYNFLSLVTEYHNFPITMTAMIVDAIVERFQTYQALTTVDVKLLVYISTEMKKSTLSEQSQSQANLPYLLNQNIALKIYNILSQMFFEDVANGISIVKALSSIFRWFSQSQAIMSVHIKTVKVSLAIYYSNVRKLTLTKQYADQIIKIDETNALLKRKNLDIQYYLKTILYLRNETFNANFEPLLCYSYLQCNGRNFNQATGLSKILSILGNVNAIVKKYTQPEKNYQQKKSKQKLSPAPPPIDQSRISNVSSLKKLTPGQNYSEYVNKMWKVRNDAQKGIQKYQKVFKDKQKKIQQEFNIKLEQDWKMSQIQKKHTNKVLQKGVKIHPSIDTLDQYFYEFNTKQNQIKKQVYYELSSLHIFDPSEEQDSHLQALKYLLKKYNKILKVFYSNYGGKIKTNPMGLPQQSIQKQNLLQLSNVWKLFKDYQLDQFMSVRQAQYLVQKLNTLRKKPYSDKSLLDFQIFEAFIVQASFTMFTRPPKNLSNYNIAELVQQTFYQFKMLAGQNRIDPRLFDDEFSIVEKDQSIAYLNIQLKSNPDYILPEGYKKIVQKKVDYYNCLSLEAFSDSYNDVIDVLQEIIFEKLGFHIIEPFSETVTNVYAKSLLSKKKDQNAEYHKEKYFSLNVKKQLFKLSGQDRLIAREVAFCLSEVVDAVEHGRKLVLRNKASPKRTIQDKKRIDEQAEQKRLKRDEQLKKILQAQKQQKLQKKRQQQQERILKIKKEEQQKNKKKIYEEQMKKKISQYQQKREIDRIKEEEIKEKQKKKQSEKYDKKRQEYLKVAKEIQKKKEVQKKDQNTVQIKKKNEKKLPTQASKKKLIPAPIPETSKKNQSLVKQTIVKPKTQTNKPKEDLAKAPKNV